MVVDAVLPELRALLDSVAAVDHHAHLLDRTEGPAPADEAVPLYELTLESNDPASAARHVREHPSQTRAVRDLAELLGTPATEAAVSDARRSMGREAYVRRLVGASRLDRMYLDDGLRRPGLLSIPEQEELTGVPARRVIRVEVAVQDAADGWPEFTELRDRFRADIRARVADGAVALKSIAAFRCGLDLAPPDEQTARAGYTAWREQGSTRLVDPHVIAYFLAEALAAADHRLPLQVHTGLVGPDTDLSAADPALLRRWLNEHVPPELPVVLLHCYPFLRHASWLAGLYPNVYLDLSMAMQWAVHRGAELVLEVLDVAPVSKLLFATDGFRVPELFYLGARWWRDALAAALARLVDTELADRAAAERFGRLVLRDNALALYEGRSAGTGEEV